MLTKPKKNATKLLSCFANGALVTFTGSMSCNFWGGFSLSSALTGSIDIKTYIDAIMAALPKKKNAKEIKPYQIISGSGDAHYMAPQFKRVIKVARGTEIYVLPLDPDKYGRYHVVDLHGRYFMVPEDEIHDVGYN